MKTLLLLRHAKSSWKEPGLADHDRPLNKRGNRTAPLMGRFLQENSLLPEMIISSPAVRARETAQLIAQSSDYSGEMLEFDELYPTVVRDCVLLIQSLSDVFDSVMLVGHNPGLEDLLQRAAGRFERLPTCALAKIEVGIDQWQDFHLDDSVQCTAVWRPRELFEI